MSKAGLKLDRVLDQISQAENEIKTLREQVAQADDKLTTELAKATLNEEKITTLEGEKEELVKQATRLSARVTALQKTIPDSEKAVAKAELKSAVIEHGEAVGAADKVLEGYKTEGLELIRTFGGMVQGLRDSRLAANDLRDKVAYYSTLLGVERPELRAANELSREEDIELANLIRSCQPMRPDAWRVSPFAAKLKKLNEATREKQFVASAESKTW